MKKHGPQLIRGITPEHPDNALPCHTPTRRPALSRLDAESELTRTKREYAQTGQSIQQLERYLATL